LSPQHPTGEHQAVEITESSRVETDWKTLTGVGIAIGTVLVAGTLAYANLRSDQRDLQARQGTTENRVSRLEEKDAKRDVDLQEIRDDVKQLTRTADRIDQNVQQLQQKGH
jgi:uncharacterized coiled-coil protein SlyX